MRKAQFHIKSIITIMFLQICLQKGFSQFAWAEIGVDGLTCSQCSRSVEMSLLKLDFIKDVQMDLESTTGKILFKTGKEISFIKISKAIKDADFSIRFLKAAYSFNNFEVVGSVILLNTSDFFCFVNIPNKNLNGDVLLTFLGKEFMPKQEYNKWKEDIEKACGNIKKKSYYITVQS